MNAISSYRGNRPTPTHLQTHKQIGLITIHYAAAIAQYNEKQEAKATQKIKRRQKSEIKLAKHVCSAID